LGSPSIPSELHLNPVAALRLLQVRPADNVLEDTDPADTQELETIVDCSFGSPCIEPIFGPTSVFPYWSSVSLATGSAAAWFVVFDSGDAQAALKKSQGRYRAVRTGL
jgi:hypothetical protein